MSIYSCTELFEGRKGSFNIDHGQREYTRVFMVVTDVTGVEATTITNAVDPVTGVFVPALASAYPHDAGALLKKKELANASELYTEWIVTCNYDSKFPSPEFQNQDPLSRPPKWNFGVAKYQKALVVDQLGHPFVNSACMPFDPPYEHEESRPTIEITVAKASFSYPYITTIANALNNSTWNGFSPWVVRCDSVVATQQWENAITFWELKYNLTINWDGWQPVKILDQGMYERVCTTASSTSSTGSIASLSPGWGEVPVPSSPGEGLPVCGCNGQLRLIKDNLGFPVTQNVLLNGAGQRGTLPYYIWFYPFRAVDLSGIP